MEKYIPIGFTKKCHGLKGELKVHITDQYLEDFTKAPVVFIEIKGKHVPHFIEQVRIGNDLILKMEDIDSKETAQELTSKEMFLQPKHILKIEEREFESSDEDLLFEKYLDFSIIDTNLGDIGKIEEIVEFPQQEMAVVIRNEKEIYIPLHDDLIENIDLEKQYIYMSLPEGILEL